LLLDRDGVIIHDVHHIVDSTDVSLMTHIPELMESAMDHGYTIAILTNQSFLARGLASFQSYLDVTEKMCELLTSKSLPHIVLSSFWHPSYSPPSIMSSWRKPNNGMFQYLINHFGCNPRNSLMIGDKLTDLQPAAMSNIHNLYHINTSNHPDELKKVKCWTHDSMNNVTFLSTLPESLPLLFRKSIKNG